MQFKPGSHTNKGEDSMTLSALNPVSSSNSRIAACSGVSFGSIKPFDQ